MGWATEDYIGASVLFSAIAGSIVAAWLAARKPSDASATSDYTPRPYTVEFAEEDRVRLGRLTEAIETAGRRIPDSLHDHGRTLDNLNFAAVRPPRHRRRAATGKEPP